MAKQSKSGQAVRVFGRIDRTVARKTGKIQEGLKKGKYGVLPAKLATLNVEEKAQSKKQKYVKRQIGKGA